MELTTERKILLGSIIFSVFLITLGIVTFDIGVLANGIILSVFIIAIPIFFFSYEKQRTLKEYEERLPSFLRDVTESLRAGMPLHQAIIESGKLDYGRLTKEVKKMVNQISWGIPVDKVIDQFTERVKGSSRLFTSLKTVREAYKTGGDMTSTIESVAANLNDLNESEKEKKSLLNEYVILMYAITFIFLGILVTINRLMIPIFQVSSTAGGELIGFVNPCSGTGDPICTIFDVGKYALFVKDFDSIGAYYASIFFWMSMIVAISSGLVVGEISDNSLVSGVKHSLIMSAGVWGSLLFLSATSLLGV